MRLILPLICLLPISLLPACQSQSELLPQAEFASNLVELCGQTFEGKVVSDDPEDADWRAETLTLGPIDCSGIAVSLPLAVGADKSRVWKIMPPSAGDDWINLTHVHTLKDGSIDPVSGYGGKTLSEGTASLQEFPADAFSKTLFQENGLEASVTNVWSLEIKPDEVLAYELNREGRHFRAEFDLTQPQ